MLLKTVTKTVIYPGFADEEVPLHIGHEGVRGQSPGEKRIFENLGKIS